VVVDAHQHFWVLNQFTRAFPLPQHAAIYRDFLPEHLTAELDRSGVDGTVLVQAAPSLLESEWLLELAQAQPRVWGVVGWVDLDQPSEHFTRDLARLESFPKFRGIRPMLQDLPDVGWILRPAVLDNLKLLAARGHRLDLLIYHHHIPAVLRALEQVPNLPAIVDHLAKPPMAPAADALWRTRLQALAAMPNVWCKVSGLATEAGPGRWHPSHLLPYVQHAASVFGPERLVFGSDWPVCLGTASYAEVYEVMQHTLGAAVAPEDMGGVLGAHAVHFYGLEPPARVAPPAEGSPAT
jgi:L-fuconolactonase